VQHKLVAPAKKSDSKARPLTREKLGCQVQAFSHFVSFSFSTNFVGGNLPLMTAHPPHLASTLMAGACGALHFLQ
jgi:hypothetical protein